MDKEVDRSLNNVLPPEIPYSGIQTASQSPIDLSGEVQLPDDLDLIFCGNVFLITQLDSSDSIKESDENNIGVASLTITCDNGRLFFLSI